MSEICRGILTRVAEEVVLIARTKEIHIKRISCECDLIERELLGRNVKGLKKLTLLKFTLICKKDKKRANEFSRDRNVKRTCYFREN